MLALGANFAIRPRKLDWETWKEACYSCLRNFCIKNFFSKKTEYRFPLEFPKSNSNWIPNDRVYNELTRVRYPLLQFNNGVRLNLTRVQKQALRDLATRTDLLVTLTDKNLGLAIIEREEYSMRMKTELELTPDSFRQLQISVEDLQKIQKKIIIDTMTTIMSSQDPRAKNAANTVAKYMDGPFHLCKVFGLPKLHKKGTRMRLVFPMSSHPLGPIHKFIAISLSHAVNRYPSVLFNVMEIVDELIEKSWPGNLRIVKADIATFYPSADRELVFNSVQETITNDHCLQRFLPIHQWMKIIKDAHKMLEFEFNNTLFEQVKGVPIGSACGPPLAILALHSSINKNDEFNKMMAKLKSPFLKIYFDDVFGIVDGSEEQFKLEINNVFQRTHCFQLDPTSFECKTIESLVSDPIDILDIEIYAIPDPTITGNYILKSRPYYKTIGAYQYVPWRSAHPPAVKTAIIRGELIRRLRLCSTEQDWTLSKEDLQKKLRIRGFPTKAIQLQCEKVIWEHHSSMLRKNIDNIRARRNQQCAWTLEIIPHNPRYVVPLVVPYDPRCHASVKDIRQYFQEVIDNICKIERINDSPRVVIAFKMHKRLLAILQKPLPHLVNPHSRPQPITPHP